MTEEKIKNYFLGKLSEADASRLEIELADDEILFEVSQISEQELIDEYLHNQLSSEQKQLFETKYLVTQARIKRLAIAKDFSNIINCEPRSLELQTEQQSFWKSSYAGFQSNKVIAISCLAILIVGGIFAIWITKPKTPFVAQQKNTNLATTPINGNENELANTNFNNVSPNPVSNSKTSEVKNSKRTPSPEVTTTPTPEIHQPITPTVASFTLFPGTLRSNGEQFVKIKPETASVKFSLSLPKESVKYQSYSASIKTADGKTIFTSNNLISLNFKLSSDKLKNQTYIIFLEGNNPQKPAESIAEYTFRVNR